MIKINLLPRTINQKLVIRNTAIMLGLLLALVVAGGVAYGFKLKGDVATMEELATQTETWEAKVKNLQQQAQQVTASIKPIQDKLDFINHVLDYNLQYPKLYEQVARWTYDRVSLLSLQCDGQQVMLQAKVKTLDDLGRYLLNMYQASDLFTEVTISEIPGYGESGLQSYNEQMSTPPARMGGRIDGSMAGLAGIQAIEQGVQRAAAGVYAGGWINFTVSCKLKKPVVAPQFGGAAAGAGAPGQPGGMPQPMAPMSPTPGSEGGPPM